MTEQEILNRARDIMDFVIRTEDRVPYDRAKKLSDAEHDELNDDDIMSLDDAEHDDDLVSLDED